MNDPEHVKHVSRGTKRVICWRNIPSARLSSRTQLSSFVVTFVALLNHLSSLSLSRYWELGDTHGSLHYQYQYLISIIDHHHACSVLALHVPHGSLPYYRGHNRSRYTLCHGWFTYFGRLASAALPHLASSGFRPVLAPDCTLRVWHDPRDLSRSLVSLTLFPVCRETPVPHADAFMCRKSKNTTP